MDKTDAKKRSHKAEIVRFLVIGIVATIFDLLTKLLVSGLLKNTNEWLSLGISTFAGFVIGVAVNYIFSVLWVFQNVADKNAAKKQSKLWLFVLLGFIGLLISLGIFYGSHYFFLAVTSGAIDIVSGSKSPMDIFHGDWSFFSNGSFWVYFGIFCVSTLIVLVWNYKSRKKWIFIEPKEDAPSVGQVEASAEPKKGDKK